MKYILIFTIVLSSILFASNESTKNTTVNKQLQMQMEKEKQISQDQTFHQGADYDLKSQEINLDSLKSSSLDSNPALNEPDDDFDMDDVY